MLKVAGFVLAFLLAIYFHPATHVFFTKYSVVTHDTIDSPDGEVLLLAVTVSKVPVSESLTREIIAKEAKGDYAGVEICYFKAFHLPSGRRGWKRTEHARLDMVRGEADDMYSCSADGTEIAKREQGEALMIVELSDDEKLEEMTNDRIGGEEEGGDAGSE